MGFWGFGVGAYAMTIYIMNFQLIQVELRDIKLIRIVVPALAILDIIALVRMISFIHLFMVLPSINRNNILKRNRQNGVEFKFPILAFKQYRKQLKHQRSLSLDSINSEQTCAICCEEFKPQDQIVILTCNIKHYFNRNCIAKWLQDHNTCPLCKEDVCKYSALQLEEGNLNNGISARAVPINLTSQGNSSSNYNSVIERIYQNNGSPQLSRDNSNVSGIRQNLFNSVSNQTHPRSPPQSPPLQHRAQFLIQTLNTNSNNNNNSEVNTISNDSSNNNNNFNSRRLGGNIRNRGRDELYEDVNNYTQSQNILITT